MSFGFGGVYGRRAGGGGGGKKKKKKRTLEHLRSRISWRWVDSIEALLPVNEEGDSCIDLTIEELAEVRCAHCTPVRYRHYICILGQRSGLQTLMGTATGQGQEEGGGDGEGEGGGAPPLRARYYHADEVPRALQMQALTGDLGVLGHVPHYLRAITGKEQHLLLYGFFRKGLKGCPPSYLPVVRVRTWDLGNMDVKVTCDVFQSRAASAPPPHKIMTSAANTRFEAGKFVDLKRDRTGEKRLYILPTLQEVEITGACRTPFRLSERGGSTVASGPEEENEILQEFIDHINLHFGINVALDAVEIPSSKTEKKKKKDKAKPAHLDDDFYDEEEEEEEEDDDDLDGDDELASAGAADEESEESSSEEPAAKKDTGGPAGKQAKGGKKLKGEALMQKLATERAIQMTRSKQPPQMEPTRYYARIEYHSQKRGLCNMRHEGDPAERTGLMIPSSFLRATLPPTQRVTEMDASVIVNDLDKTIREGHRLVRNDSASVTTYFGD